MKAIYAILNLILPGLSQVILKDYIKGVLIFLCYVAAIMTMEFIVGLFIFPIVIIYAIVDILKRDLQKPST